MAAEKEKAVEGETKEPQSSRRRLWRSTSDRYVSGVCGGVAENFGIDSWIVRLAWGGAVCLAGTGLFAYIIAWVIVPENPAQTPGPTNKTRNSSVAWGVVLVVIGCLFLLRELNWFDFHTFRHYYYWHPRFWDFDFDLTVPTLLIAAGAFYIFSVMKKDKSKESTEKNLQSGGQKVDKKLTRSTKERMISGVCGGLATYFDIDPSLVRIGFALLTLASGGLAGIVAYIVMMVVIPEDVSATTAAPVAEKTAPPEADKSKRRPKRTTTKLKKP